MTVLKFNPTYLILDDIVGMKNDRVLAHAVQNGFSILFKTGDKGGTVILKRT